MKKEFNFCPACGEKVKIKKANFCSDCGQELKLKAEIIEVPVPVVTQPWPYIAQPVIITQPNTDPYNPTPWDPYKITCGSVGISSDANSTNTQIWM